MERFPAWTLRLGILPKLGLSLAILGGLSVVGVFLAVGIQEGSGRLFVIALVGWGLTTALLLLVIHFHLVLPLRSLIGAAEALKAGDYSAPIKKVTLDETGQLADAFEGMRWEIYLAVERAERARQEWQATFDTIRD
jgi:HAMP domain-containing protein